MSAAEADVAGLPTDPGSRLRRQREQAGLTEQQVADQLNLDSGIVGALEHNDYSTLGAPVFVRGHIRRYATLVGADPAEILAAYDRSRSGPGQPTLIPRSREEMKPMRTRERARVVPRFAAGAKRCALKEHAPAGEPNEEGSRALFKRDSIRKPKEVCNRNRYELRETTSHLLTKDLVSRA